MTGVQEAVAPVFGTVVFFYGGRPFLAGAVSELRARQPGMMTLIALAITVAFVAVAATVSGWLDLEFWWELAALIVIMLLGHWLEMRAVGQARGALPRWPSCCPTRPSAFATAAVETVAGRALRPGDVVLVRPGGRVPADGEVVDGAAEVDESMITGESRPVGEATGDRVVAGTVATDSALRVRVDAVGEDTALAGIQRLVAEAQGSRSRAQALADRAAAAALLRRGRRGSGDVRGVDAAGRGRRRRHADRHRARDRVPARARPGDPAGDRDRPPSLAARAGILVRDRLSLERMRTRRRRAVRQDGHADRAASTWWSARAAVDGDEDALLALAAAVEATSEHPLARAIVAAARERNGGIPAGEDFRALPGRGVEARGRRDDGGGRRAGAAARAGRSSRRRSSTARSTAGGRAARRCCTSSATGRSPERSRSRTRSGPSRARRSTSCTGAACAWR